MSSFFTIPYIAFLGFILLLILGVYIFLVRKMASQNNQFCSIVGVVTSLADELTRLKEFISTTLTNRPKEIPIVSTQNDLIQVSDDSDSDTESETDTESMTDSDEDDDDEYELTNSIDIDLNNDIKYIHITPSIKDDDLIKVSEKLLNEVSESLPLESLHLEPLATESLPLESLHLEPLATESLPLKPLATEPLPLEPLSLTTEEESVKEDDYKKLSLNKLRSLVVEKGLVEDASKLKKQSLLQLLEQN